MPKTPVTIEVIDGMVVVKFPVDGDEGPSKSQKTTIVASTHGNVRVPGTDITIGVNAYK